MMCVVPRLTGRLGEYPRSHQPKPALRNVILGRRSSVLMGVTSKSVLLPVQEVQNRLGVATDQWFWSVCSGNAFCPCAQALFCTEQVQVPCCAPVELGHRLINRAVQTSLNVVGMSGRPLNG